MSNHRVTPQHVEGYLAACHDLTGLFKSEREHRYAMRKVEKHIEETKKNFQTCQLKGVFTLRRKSETAEAIAFVSMWEKIYCAIVVSLVLVAGVYYTLHPEADKIAQAEKIAPPIPQSYFFDPLEGTDYHPPEEQ